MTQPAATETNSPVPPSPPNRPMAAFHFPRVQEAGLLVVILLLGLLLTFAAEPITVRGQTVNNFFRLDNLIPNVATPMSWMAIMAMGVTLVIVSGGIDISVGSIFGLVGARHGGGAAESSRENASPWVVLAAGGDRAARHWVGLRLDQRRARRGPADASVHRDAGHAEHLSRDCADLGADEIAAVGRQIVAGSVHRAFHVLADSTIPRGNAPPLLLQPVPMIVMVVCVIAGWVFLSHTVAGPRDLRGRRQRGGGAIQRPARRADQTARLRVVRSGGGNRRDGFDWVLRVGQHRHGRRLRTDGHRRGRGGRREPDGRTRLGAGRGARAR